MVVRVGIMQETGVASMVNSGFALCVSRKRKAPEVVPVDEVAGNVPEDCIRLDPVRDVKSDDDVIRLEPGPEEVPKEAQELVVRSRAEVVTRSNAPRVKMLAESGLRNAPGLEEQWDKTQVHHRSFPWGWFGLVALVLTGATIWSLRNILFAKEDLEVIRIKTESILQTEEASLEAARGLIGRIEATITAYCMAPDVDTLSHFVRHMHRVKPLMEDYYSRHPYEPLGPARIESLSPLTLGAYGEFWAVVLRLRSGEKQNLVVEAGAHGQTLVDWETAVNYQPMPWDDFARERPEGVAMDFRVFLEPNVLYSHEFQDSSEWDCYMLTAHDSEEFLFGYVRSDSPTARLLKRWFDAHSARRAPMIMRLSIPEGLTSPRGVVIDHALSVRWVYIKSPGGDEPLE